MQNKNNYKISVIVPIYNVERYISRCIDSIVRQTYKNLEIICVNDGSVDNSRKIVECYAKSDKRIKIIDKLNGGLATARNTGLKFASGDFVSFVDGDDAIVKDAYEKILLCVDEDIDAILFEPFVMYQSSNIEKEFYKNDKQWFTLKYTGKQIFTDDMLLKVNCNAWNKMIRLRTIRELEVSFPDGYLYEDAVFFFNLFSIVKNVYFLKQKLYIYNRHSNSIMSLTLQKKPNYGINHIYILDKIYEFWINKKIFCGRELVFQQIIVKYYKYALRSVPNYEKARVLWELTKRLKKWDLKFDKKSLLYHIAEGEYDIIFRSNISFFNRIYELFKQ